jgi:hypothetical protein
MNTINKNEFIFSEKYRLQRHLVYWGAHVILWGSFWAIMVYWTGHEFNLPHNMFKMVVWTPAFMLFSFPIIYWAIPHLLLKEKYLQFAAAIILWGIFGLFINEWFRQYIFIPVQEYVGFTEIGRDVRSPSSYLCMTTTAAEASILVLFKHWTKKQNDWMRSQKEKVTAELKLLKAQVHPHFLFNTLNNIYSFSLQQSPKTPELILKLSSLLSYMLYDCKAEQVALEKELEIMKNYIDLERERYGNKIDISINIEGDIHDQYITPLLLLPFLENAFKHGISEQLGKPWLSFDLAVTNNVLQCKIVNSKNEIVPLSENGIGIKNVRKRLQFLCPDCHELKLTDEGNFFVVSLELHLKPIAAQQPVFYTIPHNNKPVHETALSVNR